MGAVARQLLGLLAMVMSLVMLGLGVAVNIGDVAWQVRVLFTLMALNSWVVGRQGWLWLWSYFDLELVLLTLDNPHVYRARALAQENLNELTNAVANGQRDCQVLWEPGTWASPTPTGWFRVAAIAGDYLLAWQPGFSGSQPTRGESDEGPYAVPHSGPTVAPTQRPLLGPLATRQGLPQSSPWGAPSGTTGAQSADSDARWHEEPPADAVTFSIPVSQVLDFVVPLPRPQNGKQTRGHYTKLAQLQTLLDSGYRAFPTQQRLVEQHSSYEHWGFPRR